MKMIIQYKLFFSLFLAVIVVGVVCGDSAEHKVQVVIRSSDSVKEPINLFVGMIVYKDCSDNFYKQFESNFKRCLEYNKNFSLKIQKFSEPPSKKECIKKLFHDGHDCAIFITLNGSAQLPAHSIEWRLYDTFLGTMIRGKRYTVNGTVRSAVYHMAQNLTAELMAQEGCFLSKIAYRKKDSSCKNTLCVADFDGSGIETLVQSSRIVIAPQWNRDVYCPMLLCSEFREKNVCLVAFDMHGRKRAMLDIDGTTVGISYSSTKSRLHQVIYCHSGSLWRYSYDKHRNKGVHTLIVKESAPCASPNLADSGNVFYCCQGKIKEYHADTKKTTTLISEGYCVGPSYSQKNNSIVYSKRVGSTMQLFVYDCVSKKNKQITFQKGGQLHNDYRSDKIDPCWSPCGNFCIFCWKCDRSSRIAIINVATHEYAFITDKNEYCDYPIWSCNYMTVS